MYNRRMMLDNGDLIEFMTAAEDCTPTANGCSNCAKKDSCNSECKGMLDENIAVITRQKLDSVSVSGEMKC